MSNRPKEPRLEQVTTTDPSIASQQKIIRWVGAGLQILAVALCMDMLLGISAGIGLLLRLFLLTLIGFCVILRLAWFALVALQLSLLAIEPRQGQLPANTVGFFYSLVALAVISVAMKLPEIHRFVTDYVLSWFDVESKENGSKRPFRFMGMKLAIYTLQLTLMVFVAGFLLMRLPIGLQAESWLEWSRQNGQAVWPGALLIVLMISVLVLVRENAWRQLAPSQASLYLRSVQLIANYRDLFGFERHRLRRLRKAQMLGESKSQNPVKRPKLRGSRRVDITSEKGMK